MTLHHPNYPFTNLVDLLFSNPLKRPENHPLFIDSVTGETCSLRRTRQLASGLHAGLNRFGFQKGDCLCLISPNHIHTASIMLGVMAAGGRVSPSNTSYVSDELERQLVMSKASIVIAHPENLDTTLVAVATVGIPRSHVFSICPDPLRRVQTWTDQLVDHSNNTLNPIPMTVKESKETVSFLCFSSGTSGKSKGVMTSHFNCIANVMDTVEFLKEDRDPTIHVILGALPMYHFAGIIRVILIPLFLAHTVIIQSHYNTEEMCRVIEQYKITLVPSVPPILLQLLKNPIVNKYDLSSIQIFQVGAAPISHKTIEDIRQKYDAQCLQCYGMTELSPIGMVQGAETYIPNSVGRLLPTMDGKVIDKCGRALPPGQVGEILLRGPNVMLGYLDDIAATRAAIDENGYLHTGDVGRVDERGNWFIVDRVKELIKYKGFQVAPAELEALLITCPEVADAAVVGVFDEARETEVPRAYIVGTANDGGTATKIMDWVAQRAAPHKRLRGGVCFVDAIPKSPAGKILRNELRKLQRHERSEKANAHGYYHPRAMTVSKL